MNFLEENYFIRIFSQWPKQDLTNASKDSKELQLRTEIWSDLKWFSPRLASGKPLLLLQFFVFFFLFLFSIHRMSDTFGVPWPDFNDGLTYTDLVSTSASGRYTTSCWKHGVYWTFIELDSEKFSVVFFSLFNRVDIDRLLLQQAQEFRSLARVIVF